MEPSGEKKPFRPSLLHFLLAFWAILVVQQVLSTTIEPDKMAYSDFRAALAEGRLHDVAISPAVIRGHLRTPETRDKSERAAAGEPPEAPAAPVAATKHSADAPDLADRAPTRPPSETAATRPAGGKGPGPRPEASDAGPAFETNRVDDPELFKELQRQGVRVTGVIEHRFFSGAMAWLLPLGVFALLWMVMARRLGSGGHNGFMAIGRSKAKIYMEKDVKVSFADVAGVDEAKQELQEVLDFLRAPGRFGRLGAKLPKGVLLVGPPGTGKTLLARAVAGEAGVPFFSISGSDFVEMFVGVGAARVRDLFDQAKQRAPCIVFVDELDALGKARGVGPVTHEEREQTLNQLLVELDGFDARLGVILMAATNRPEILDPALLRAGRFDRQVLVDRPDKADRVAILRLHASKVPVESQADLETIAAMTAGFVGADLANVINEAALLGVRRDKDRVGLAELQDAVERIVAGLEKKNRVLSADEKRRVAYHELGHALVALSLPSTDDVQKISIIPRGIGALGYTWQVPTEDRFLMTESELRDKIAVLMGGRVAEELIYDEVSTGAHDDLTKATDIARSMVKTYGMSPKLGQVSLEKDRRGHFLAAPEPSTGGRSDYSEETAREIDDEVRRLVHEQRQRASDLLSARHAVLVRAARELLARETISGDELRRLIRDEEESPRPPVATLGADPESARAQANEAADHVPS